jgi:hypothetical protein
MYNKEFIQPFYPINIISTKQKEDEKLIENYIDYKKGKLFEIKYKGELIGRLKYYRFRWYGGCYINEISFEQIKKINTTLPIDYYGAKLNKLEIIKLKIESNNKICLWMKYKHYNEDNDIRLPSNLYYTRDQIANDMIAIYYYINNIK